MIGSISRSDQEMKIPGNQVFQFISGNLALDFVNTVGDRLGDAKDRLDTPASFVQWLKDAGLFKKGVARSISATQLEKIREVREELYCLFQSLASGDKLSPRGLVALNARLAGILSNRQLIYKMGRVEWDWVKSEQGLDTLLGPILLSAADLLVTGQSTRVGMCEGETCGWLFLDHSRSGRRRWCRMADCGNRAKAFRHYNRKNQVVSAKN